MNIRPAHVAAAALLVLTLPPGALAQTFEGTVTFRTRNGGQMAYSMGQGKVRVDVDHEGRQASMIMDPATHTMDMVMPEQRMYMEMSIPEAEATDDTKLDAEITRTGRTEIVAGHKCEYWHIHSKNGGDDADACVTNDFGRFFTARGPMMRGRTAAWETAFGGKPAFPLKVVAQHDGQSETVMEATKIEPKKLDASFFAPPAGFRKMSMPMMGGHH